MLSTEQLQGMWVSMPTEWDADGNLDEALFRDEIAMLIEARPHGLYTTGSTGEFYALDWDDYQQVTSVFLDEVGGKIPVQVGANWFNTRDTIRRVRYARDHGADAVQICFPGWMIMPEAHYDQFLIDVYEAVPDIALIHYNVGRTKKLFGAADYSRVLDRVPTLLGTKAGVPFMDLLKLNLYVPELRHFTGEAVFALAHQIGVRGMYTSWFLMAPDFFHSYYNLCVEGRYAEGIAISRRMVRWLDGAVQWLLDKGYQDPVLDKAFLAMGGRFPGNRRTRAPYLPLPDEEMAELTRRTEELMPEFLVHRG